MKRGRRRGGRLVQGGHDEGYYRWGSGEGLGTGVMQWMGDSWDVEVVGKRDSDVLGARVSG